MGPNTTIGWKNLYSITSQDRVLMRNGTRQPIDAPNQVLRQSARWFTNNQIVSSQLNGSHYFESFKGKFQWLGSYSGISRSVPNLRNTLYYGDTDVADTAWRAASSLGPAQPALRSDRVDDLRREVMAVLEPMRGEDGIYRNRSDMQLVIARRP